jgi:GNAT superfamily N-acetyltransferase
MLIPLDRESLARIPTPDGKSYIAGPYTFEELLQEPDEKTEATVDFRYGSVAESEGVSISSAYIEVIRKTFSRNVTIGPDSSGRITLETRYVFRRDCNLPIEGAVTLHANYVLHGVLQKYATECKTVINSVYVTPASRGQGIARVILAEVLKDAPDAEVGPNFSKDGARLFGFDAFGKRLFSPNYKVKA